MVEVFGGKDFAMANLTIKDVVKLVAKVRQLAEADDNERAHGLEDGVHHTVLAAIADGLCDDPAGCAREALKTNGIRFTRWYA